MKKLISIAFLICFLFISGCVLEYRENLPAEIVITETAELVPESIVCENPPCATLVQMSEVKRTEYICSPSYKEANNDPQGVTYKTQLGDSCEALPSATTLCLRYDCNYNPEDNIGYNELKCSYSHTATIWIPSISLGIPIPVSKFSYDMSTGVSYPDSNLITQMGKKCNYGSLGGFSTGGGKENFEFLYNYYSNYPEKTKIGTFFEWGPIGGWHKTNSKIIGVFQKNCLAEMPIKYPYNAIDFAYNPILDSSESPDKNKLLFNLIQDYVLLDEYKKNYLVKAEGDGSNLDDPCSEICEKTGEVTGEEVDVEECNKCQEERRKDLKDGMKSKGTSADAVFFSVDYLIGDLNPNEENPSSSICTGITPCVEIDRVIPDDEQDPRYFICNCMCDAVLYTGYICNRAGDSTEYYYTSCEVNNIKSDQGGYIFSIHGFEAELFKNVLSNSENKMPTFMVGQGSTFKDYFSAKEKCLPDVTADEMVVAGNHPFSPEFIEVIVGSPICFKNDGSRSRKISLNDYNNIILTLNSSDSVCLETGEDTLFELSSSSYKIYVDDNPVGADVYILDPQNLDNTLNTIKRNENDQLKFFFNNNIELSLLYASAPRSSSMNYFLFDSTGSHTVKFTTYDSGEFPIYNLEILSDSDTGTRNPLTWIAYETGFDSMRVSERNLFDDKYDLNKDGYIDLYDLLDCENYEVLTGNPICSELINKYSYFKDLISNKKYLDYPTIKKSSKYFEFTPGAIILPVGSEFCVNNSMYKKIDLILEKKYNPRYSSEISGVGLVDVPPIEPIKIDYIDAPSNYIKYLDSSSLVTKFLHLNSIGKSNVHYEFVEGKSLYQGLQCCFNLGEPGIYRVSSLGGETGTGYVVVLPDDVGNILTLNDYEYQPEYVIPKGKDFVCVRNPYDFDREIEIENLNSGSSEIIELKSSTETCSYDWASHKGNNYLFKDFTTGGKFELEVTDSEILNVEVISNFFTGYKGKVNSEGTICFVSKDDAISIISVYDVFTGKEIPGKEVYLEGNSIKCFSNWLNDGLYKLKMTQEDEESLVVIEDGNYHLVVGEENEGYIYNSKFHGGPLIITLENFDNLFDIFVEKTDRTIKIFNNDDVEYHLYSVIKFNEHMGFFTPINYIQTPEILFENTGSNEIQINVLNYDSSLIDSESKTFVVEPESSRVYLFEEGDYRVEILNGLEKLKTSVEIPMSVNEKTSIDASRMIMFKGDEYIVDGISKDFEYGKPLKFKKNIFLNVSTSQTQRVSFGYEDSKGIVLVDSFIIDSVISKKNVIELQRMTGSLQNLDFGVQVLNDVPSFDMLLDAKKLLAYDQSLPIFMYSRIGSIDVGVDNPFKTEVYNIPLGAKVDYVISDWLQEKISQNKAKVVSSSPVTKQLEGDITFTISTDFSSSEKEIIVKAVEPSKTIIMDYTELEVVDDNPSDTGFKRYFINNLAYEPRAFSFIPSQRNDLCFEIKGSTSKTIKLGASGVKRTASNMILYSLNEEGPVKLDHISYHSSLYSEKNKEKISDINVIYNYGVNVNGIDLVRDDGGDNEDSGDNEVGVLYLKANFEKALNSPNDFKLIRFTDGYISGLDNLNFIRAYRFYGNADIMKINVDSSVYGSSYSVLARGFTDKKQTGDTHLNNLLSVANVYLRAKDYKAVPNKWYMAGLYDTTFENLTKPYYTYLEGKGKLNDYKEGNNGETKSFNVGEHAKWVNTGCGDYVFVVPFNNSHIFQTFAYDVPVSKDSSNALKNKADYIHTINSNYQTAIQRVDRDSPVSFKIYNGEIINDIRLLLSENPTVADEICGYYDISNPFKTTGDFAKDYSGWEFKDDVFEYNDKNDFELKVSKTNNIFNKNNPDESKPVMIYTPTGMYCGWGGGDGIYGVTPKCDGTYPEGCRGNYGLCGKSSNCLEEIIGTKEQLYKKLEENCEEEYQECVSKCEGDFAAVCASVCLSQRNICSNPFVLEGSMTNLDKCYYELEQLDKGKCDPFFEGDNCLLSTTNVVFNTNCSEYKIGEYLGNYLMDKKETFFTCINSLKLPSKDVTSCEKGAGFDSMDEDSTSNIWWCRYNIDAFGHETQMFCSGDDCWNFVNVQSLAESFGGDPTVVNMFSFI